MAESGTQLTFSDELRQLLTRAGGKSLSLFAVENILAERGVAALILILCLPFIQPIPLPGLSSIFGFGIFVLALRIMVGQKGKLPEFIGKREIDFVTLEKLVNGSVKLLKRAESFFRPRYTGFVLGKMRVIAGISICVSAVALALPIPPIVPLTNTIPALAIIFLALGLLEEDGLFAIFGHVVAVLTWLYLFIWWEILLATVKAVLPYLDPYLEPILSRIAALFS